MESDDVKIDFPRVFMTGNNELVKCWSIVTFMDKHGNEVGILLNSITGQTFQYRNIELGWIPCKYEGK
jgi:hypothetical protein